MSETAMFQVRKNGLYSKHGTKWLGRENMDSIREQILAERDKETPYSVVEGEYTIARFLERELAEEFVKKMGHEFMRILPEEPKPWHSAKPGEVWRLTYRTPSAKEISNPVMTCVMDGPNVSFFNEWRLHTVHYSGIESAERIWPES